MKRPSIDIKKDIFIGRRQSFPPSNFPPTGRKLIGSHEEPEPKDPLYLRWQEEQYKQEDVPNLQVQSKEQTVHNWQVPTHPKLARERILYQIVEIPPTSLYSPEAIRSRPISNVFLAVVFALAVCCRRS